MGDIVGRATGTAAAAAKKSFGMAGYVFGLARGTASAGTHAAQEAVTLLRSARGGVTTGPAGGTAPAAGAAGSADRAADEPQVVLREPGPPEEPPVDVVGEALAAEAEGAPPTAADEMLAELNAEPQDSQGASGHTEGEPLADPAQVARVLSEKETGDAASDPDKG